MTSKKANIGLSEEADSIIQALFGENVSTPTSTIEEPAEVSSSMSEIYQLPVRIGRAGKSLDEGDKPWIVGHFSPGVQTDHNHPTGHNGVDLKAPHGTPVYPIASGVVVQAGQSGKSGIFVTVAHEGGKVRSFYGHLASSSAQVNQKVTQRTAVGTVGETGNAKGRGAHLHYEVKVEGSLINPFGIVGKQVGSLSKKAELLSHIEKLAEQLEELLSSE